MTASLFIEASDTVTRTFLADLTLMTLQPGSVFALSPPLATEFRCSNIGHQLHGRMNCYCNLAPKSRVLRGRTKKEQELELAWPGGGIFTVASRMAEVQLSLETVPTLVLLTPELPEMVKIRWK